MVLLSTVDIISKLGDDASKIEVSVVSDIVDDSISEINHQLNTDIRREKIIFIDMSRRNLIDGVNKKFYLQGYQNGFLADSTGDGNVTKDDVIIYAIAFTGEETILEIESVDYTEMSVTLVESPKNVRLFSDHARSYHDMVTPDRRVKRAVEAYAMMNSYFEIEFDLVGTSVKMGNMSYSGIGTNSKTSKWKNKYKTIMSDLKSYGSAKNRPSKFNVTKPLNYRPGRIYGQRGTARGEDVYYDLYSGIYGDAVNGY